MLYLYLSHAAFMFLCDLVRHPWQLSSASVVFPYLHIDFMLPVPHNFRIRIMCILLIAYVQKLLILYNYIVGCMQSSRRENGVLMYRGIAWPSERPS